MTRTHRLRANGVITPQKPLNPANIAHRDDREIFRDRHTLLFDIIFGVATTSARAKLLAMRTAPARLAHFERRHSTVTQYGFLFATQTNSGPPPITIASARR